MAVLNLPYPNIDFVPLDILTAAEQNQLVANINYLAEFGQGLANGTNISDNAVGVRLVDFASVTPESYNLVAGVEVATNERIGDVVVYVRRITGTFSAAAGTNTSHQLTTGVGRMIEVTGDMSWNNLRLLPNSARWTNSGAIYYANPINASTAGVVNMVFFNSATTAQTVAYDLVIKYLKI